MFSMSMSYQAQLKRRKLLQEAETHRLHKKTRIDRPGAQERLLLGISDSLISWGLWLRTRYQLGSAAPALRAERKHA